MPSPRATAARSTMLELPLLTHLYFRSEISASSSMRGRSRLSARRISYQLGRGEYVRTGLHPPRYGRARSLLLGARWRAWDKHPHRQASARRARGRFVYGLGNLWSSKRGSTYVQSSEMYFGATLNYFFRL